jgi:hypothetical protein
MHCLPFTRLGTVCRDRTDLRGVHNEAEPASIVVMVPSSPEMRVRQSRFDAALR